MNKNIFSIRLFIVAAAMMGLCFTSCKNEQRQQDVTDQQEQQEAYEQEDATEQVDEEELAAADEDEELADEVSLTFADVAGMYDSMNEDGGNESRTVLHADGTATWNMIGSLHFTEFTYTIQGHQIFFKSADDGTDAGFSIYDPEERTLTDEGGTVYYRQ
jgi:hypothetical protein